MTPPPRPQPLDGTRPLDGEGRRQLRALNRASLFRFQWRWPFTLLALFNGIAVTVNALFWVPPVQAIGLGVAGSLVTVAAAMFPLVSLDQWRDLRISSRRPWVIGYFTDQGTQLVRPIGDSWYLSHHLATKPGRGLAGPFRRRVFRHLADEADRLQVRITMHCTVPRLVEQYQQDMVGLRVVHVQQRTLLGIRTSQRFTLERTPQHQA